MISDVGAYYAVRQMQTEVDHVEQFASAKGALSGGTVETAFEIFKRPKDSPFCLLPTNDESYAVTQDQLNSTQEEAKILSLSKLLKYDQELAKTAAAKADADTASPRELTSFNLPIDLPPSVTREYSGDKRPRAPKVSGFSAFAYCNSRVVRRTAALMHHSDKLMKSKQEPFSSAAGLSSNAGDICKHSISNFP